MKTLLEVLLTLVAAWSATNVTTTSLLFRPIRDRLNGRVRKTWTDPDFTTVPVPGWRLYLGKMSECPMCSGAWWGFGFFAMHFLAPWEGWWAMGWTIFRLGLATSVLAWCAHVVLVKLGSMEH